MTLDDLNQMTFEETDLQDLVLISFGKFDGLDEIHKVDMLLFESIPEDIGRHDGHEVNMDDTDGQFFIYGNNAEELYKTIEPLLKPFEFLKTANVYLRFTKNGEFESDLEFKMNE
jgi:hypothetical protein